jgi:exodeoxyribonuclease-3
MNKFSKILYAAMALAMAVCNFSCSDDEELPTGDLELNSGSSVTTETLKVLSYNVLEGMKLDKANDYNNFVTWVSEQAPDIMAIEETNGFTKEKHYQLVGDTPMPKCARKAAIPYLSLPNIPLKW